MCVCVIEGLEQRHHRDKVRLSTESHDKSNILHRYDSDSSLDLATHTHHYSMLPTTAALTHSLPQLSDCRPSVAVNTGSTQVYTSQGHPGSNEGHARRSDDDQCDGGDEDDDEGHRRSRDSAARCADCGCVDRADRVAVAESAQGSVAAGERRCGECGCWSGQSVSSQLCEEVTQLLSQLDTTTQYNHQVSTNHQYNHQLTVSLYFTWLC